MPLLLDHNKLPQPGKIVSNKGSGLTNTDTFLSFNQAYTNAAYPLDTSHGNEFDGENLTWTTDINTELPILFNNIGHGSMAPITLVESFANAVKKWGPLPSLHYRPKGKLDKPWEVFTWQEYWDNSCKAGKTLLSLNLKDKDVVAIMGFNQPAWLMMHFGAIFANCIPSGIYPSSAPQLVKYILNHSGAAVVCCDTLANVDKILSIKNEVPTLKQILVYYDAPTTYYKSQGVVSFEEFIEFGNGISDMALSEKMSKGKPGECSSLIYTSGTTGAPKAVMLSHDNATWTGFMTKLYTMSMPSHHILSYLPLSHIAAQIVDCYSGLFTGHQVYFANIDALQGSLLASMKEVKPSWFLGVPRVWEKIELGLKAAAANSSPMKKKMMNWVRSVGFKGTMAILEGKTPPKSYSFVDHMFLNKIRQALGLDQCFGMAVSAAPVLPATQEFFMSLGIPISNIYGLSETTGPHSFSANSPYWLKLGSCGYTLNGAETYIKNPDHNGVGELCCRGRHVFMGYYKDKKATSNVIDKNGFFSTGDTAYVDDKGRLHIVGRIKELIITAGGENVPPILIEGYVKEEIPFMTNCILVGDAKPFLSLLICVKSEMDSNGLPTTKLTQDFIGFLQSQGSKATTTIEAASDPILKNIIDKAIKLVNSKVASRAHEIKKWAILAKDFSEGTGELTSTLKLKRSVVLKKNENLIDSLYLNSSMDNLQSKM